MNTFKRGDKVICIKSSDYGFYREGSIFTVLYDRSDANGLTEQEYKYSLHLESISVYWVEKNNFRLFNYRNISFNEFFF